ncbi:DUF484 family protein [Brevundimonas bacteroides]|uniref:DUF484 family protein n=1 Tax=Brevundimonas bacteroides TaxID=74311 RepID=UPI00068BCC01|nr:DUF484 family protein [Brevundimonas bacteroides]
MSKEETADLFAPREPHWPEIRAWLQANPDTLLDDRSLLEEIGLLVRGRNVVEFGRTALTKLEAAAEREADARKRIEDVARANFAAQTQTHVAALDLMEARSHSDLARRLDAAAQARFGLSAAAIAVEKPGGVPFGWKALEPGGVDAWLGGHGLTWLGPMFPELDLFGPAGDEVKSVALIRMALHLGGERAEEARPALAAFGSPEPEGFTPGMGCELVAFVAAVVARTAERWPVLS